MPLYLALAKSFNTAAIRMSIKIGEFYWPAKQPYHLAHIAQLGRSKIVETARAMGLTTPLADTVSLPVGADEVKQIDMVGANALLANGGKQVKATMIDRIQDRDGRTIWRHDRRNCEGCNDTTWNNQQEPLLADPRHYNIAWMTVLEEVHASQSRFASIY